MLDADEGTGPESVVAARGGSMRGAYATPCAESGTILGYLSDNADIRSLRQWHVTELSQAAALAWVRVLYPTAVVQGDGTISIPG